MSTATELLTRAYEALDRFAIYDDLRDEIEVFLAAEPEADKCKHRIADARNPVVQSGYVCVDCHALFQAADHQPPKPAEPEAEPVALKHRLLQIHDALESHLGDSDSWTSEDMTDEEIREEDPIFWAAKEIASLIGDAPWDQYLHPPRPEPARKPMNGDEEMK